MHDNQQKIIVISGPSGVGKDAVISRMSLQFSNFHFTVTATTRQKRENEINLKDYIFLSKDQFQNMLVNDEFLEHAEVYGNYYGVPKKQVHEGIKNGKNVLIKIDVQGAKTIKDKEKDAVFIFLAPPNLQELEKRLKDRMTETPEALKKRVQTAEDELQESNWFDYVIINHTDKLDETITQIYEIIQAVTNQPDFKS
ncbi:MAG: guanylate kinase [Dehalococcoidia bacterium]|mgnify:FL=1